MVITEVKSCRMSSRKAPELVTEVTQSISCFCREGPQERELDDKQEPQPGDNEEPEPEKIYHEIDAKEMGPVIVFL